MLCSSAKLAAEHHGAMYERAVEGTIIALVLLSQGGTPSRLPMGKTPIRDKKPEQNEKPGTKTHPASWRCSSVPAEPLGAGTELV